MVASTSAATAPTNSSRLPCSRHSAAIVTPLPSGGEGPYVDAEGEAAAGLFGFRTDTSSGAGAVSACVAPRNSWWFTGLGADLDHSSQLVLTNLDPGPAVVPGPALRAPPGRGISSLRVIAEPRSPATFVQLTTVSGEVITPPAP